jgi:hypothetical protein
MRDWPLGKWAIGRALRRAREDVDSFKREKKKEWERACGNSLGALSLRELFRGNRQGSTLRCHLLHRLHPFCMVARRKHPVVAYLIGLETVTPLKFTFMMPRAYACALICTLHSKRRTLGRENRAGAPSGAKPQEKNKNSVAEIEWGREGRGKQNHARVGVGGVSVPLCYSFGVQPQLHWHGINVTLNVSISRIGHISVSMVSMASIAPTQLMGLNMVGYKLFLVFH